MKQREMIWRNSKKLSALEEEARERAQSLLRRAGQQRLDQEQELREMNQVLAARPAGGGAGGQVGSDLGKPDPGCFPGPPGSGSGGGPGRA